jgi:hypothetical protein
MADGVNILERLFTATIALGESLSEAVDLQGYTLVGLITPSGWDAADITLQADPGAADAGTFANVYNVDDSEHTIEAAASRHILLDPSIYVSIRRVKIRSGTSGSPVNQADAVSVTLIGRPI